MEGGDQCNILIISGGIIGYITAYYLTRRTDYDSKNHNITVITVHRIGVLAIRAYPINIATGRESCELDQLGSQTTLSLRERLGGNSEARRGESHGQGLPRDLGWVTPDVVDSYEDMGSREQGSRVDPYQFTLSMVRPARERGANTTIDSRRPANPHTINGVSELRFPSRSSRRKVSGMSFADTHSSTCTIPAITTILPIGPTQGATTTPSSPVSGYPIASEIAIPPTPPPSLQNTQPSSTFSPEIYDPCNSEIHVSGEAAIETTEYVNIAETGCCDLIAPVSCISDHICPGHRTRKQACYPPVLNFGGSGGDQIRETGTEG
ncbi:hypothetical protein HOY80DRAFT_1007994 [Tuber brumale]|nr:hypothetical protein HOY80DRAFT_1007994 [Tuber brumale]